MLVFHCLSANQLTKKQKKQRSRLLKYTKINIWRLLHTWRWPCRPKHVVKDGGNQHTIKQHADGDITCNTHWAILKLGKFPNLKDKSEDSMNFMLFQFLSNILDRFQMYSHVSYWDRLRPILNALERFTYRCPSPKTECHGNGRRKNRWTEAIFPRKTAHIPF
jgi:hypothetical protein